MRLALTALACVVALSGCGGADPQPPAATPIATATATATPAVTPVATGSRDARAARRTLVAWFQGQLDRDGERTCALMTPRAQRFYVEGFGGPCETLFGPDGAKLWSVGARFSVGAAAAAEVAVSGDVATARFLDDTYVLRRTGGRWLVDELAA